MKPFIICKNCGKEKKHYAKGLCTYCYRKEHQDKNKVSISGHNYYERNKEKILKQEKEYRQKNKEIIKIKDKKRYQKNKEKILLGAKKYREKNKEKLRLAKKIYVGKNRNKIVVRVRKWREENRKNLEYKNIFQGLKNRCVSGKIDLLEKIEFKEWLNKQKKECMYCGMSQKESYAILNRRLAIDRKDNNKGYTIENIALACYPCNTIKNQYLTSDDMLEIRPTLERVKARILSTEKEDIVLIGRNFCAKEKVLQRV
jgi:ribosomal protein L37E